MSHKVTTLVYSRVVGSAVRKGVLSYMADRASDDGRGVWCSKQTIADETEFGRSTVIRTCNEFVSEGLLLVTGDRKCANGSTVEYALNLDAIRALPVIEKKGKGSQSGTSPDVDPSQSGTPLVPERDPTHPAAGPQAVPERDPNHPVTIHEPSLNRSRADKRPDPITDELSKTASVEAAESFVAYRKRHKSKGLSLTAARRLATSLQEIFNAGHDPSDALGLAEERGWASVNLEWYLNAKGNSNDRTGSSQTGTPGGRRGGGAHHNLMAGFADVAYSDR